MVRRNKITSDCPSLATLATLSRAELITHFAAEFGATPSARASEAFLRGNLAWAWQARQQGESPAKLRSRLERAAQKAADQVPRRGARHRGRFRPGTRLVREWQGEVHSVTIEADGYRWSDHTYKSLSEIAREITGTRWSGPRFFGLTGPSS